MFLLIEILLTSSGLRELLYLSYIFNNLCLFVFFVRLVDVQYGFSRSNTWTSKESVGIHLNLRVRIERRPGEDRISKRRSPMEKETRNGPMGRHEEGPGTS